MSLKTVPRPLPISTPAVRALRGLLRLYQLAVSPLLGPACRFTPSCSEYAREALTEHGAASGTWLALRRVLRCHPFGGYGFDPVPEACSAESPSKGRGS